MLEAVAEKKMPPPLPPKTRRGCLKNGDNSGATILSSGHVVKIRIDPVISSGQDGHDKDHHLPEQPRREHHHDVTSRRSSTVKINITCVDPFVFRRHYNDDDDEDDVVDDDDDVHEDDHRRSSSGGHRSPLDSGTGSDLDTGSRRDESDDGTCSCDSMTSSTADPETTTVAADRASVVAAAATPSAVVFGARRPVAVVTTEPTGIVAMAAVATVVEEIPKRSSPIVRVQQRCYGDDAAIAATAAADRIIDMDNTDQYYSFHMNENVFDEVDGTVTAAAAAVPMDDTFAGCKTASAASSSDTIRSAKGTIRGVKNRVRAGIATFLQPKTNKVSRVWT